MSMSDWSLEEGEVFSSPSDKIDSNSSDEIFSSSKCTRGDPLLCPDICKVNGVDNADEGLREPSAQLAQESSGALQSPSHENKTILLFPPTGTGAVSVTQSDLKRLEPEKCLNDTLIDLGLKLWLQNIRSSSPELAEQIHIFSTFFYTQLTRKHDEEGYQSVRKWTSEFDLFEKKYVIIPIHQNMHWYLAIICYPGQIFHPPPRTPSVIARNQIYNVLCRGIFRGNMLAQRATSASEFVYTPPTFSTREKREQEVNMIVDTQAIPSSQSPSKVPDSPEEVPVMPSNDCPDAKMCSVSIEEQTEINKPNDGMEVDDTPPSLEPEAPCSWPYIFAFDSLGLSRNGALKVLSRYLELEAVYKKSEFSTTPVKMIQAPVPRQPNDSDCGIYLLYFVEKFMSDPEKFINWITDHTESKKFVCIDKMWEHSAVKGKRESLKQTVLSLASNWKQGNTLSQTHSDHATLDNDSDIEVINKNCEDC